ncbi:hypothetical protein [Pseudoalteromonas tunicata]|jgi:hypothetical protein|uniref:Uncharacterized protein n=1 Tax=Pseudoalteromonas tunicata D2 TaxID=87626 RepID=A4CBB9_9GAMM|nr:hypothetical protein [Pseudoalteromonas tunicata]ATC94211.1 hypothetical protein PTUN_a1603 [Pseudoalteromonas tunicata]AXT29970.1 hypothetical protein D1819_03590 [Pseudoalteromonas tunicata]EAR27656.1 hypothetical protein PTD2_17580 [Pseudoalteromonas tunicata D2]MDP4983033.1 hypothetical protein [Pseudoalteromonas tunicata]MDP5211439.1 hypothetical protein [Pseudoalteromonas tunicata]
MLTCDLRAFVCPQLFVLFKYQLKQVDFTKQSIEFTLLAQSDSADIERYLTANHFVYQITLTNKLKTIFVMEQGRRV